GVIELVEAVGLVGIARIEEVSVDWIDGDRLVTQPFQQQWKAVAQARRQHEWRVHAGWAEDVLWHAAEYGEFTHPGAATEGMRAQRTVGAGVLVGLEHPHMALRDGAAGEVGGIERALLQYLDNVWVLTWRISRCRSVLGRGGPVVLRRHCVAHGGQL